MRILLVTQYFYPEQFKSNDLAFELQKRGHQVTVLTGLPNYPGGKFYKGYGVFKKRRETVEGVDVIRTLVVPRGNGSGVRLAINYLSWAFFASLRALTLSFQKRFDAIIVHETSPITRGYPALLVRKIQRIPIYFWVLDLWPESLQSAGNINNEFVLNIFKRETKRMYEHSHKILVSSKGFIKSILEKGEYLDKLEYFPNWAEDLFENAEIKPIPDLKAGFKVMFAGNIGEAQDFEHVMQAALLLKKEKNIQFIFIGDGRRKEWVDSFIEKHQLSDTVSALGRFPIDLMPSFFKQADVMLLALKDDYIFSLTAPAKLQAYMAAAKPVVAMIDGEARNLIADSNCGVSSPAKDYQGLAENILKLSKMNGDDLRAYGENGWNYYRKYFTKEKCIDNLCAMLADGNSN